MLLTLPWILPVLLGHAALSAMVDPQTRARAGALVVWASVIPLGLGLTSVVYFAGAVVLGPEVWKTSLVELAVLLLAASIAARARLRAAPALASSRTDAQPSPLWLRAGVVLGLAGAAASFVLQARELPFGDADGVGIWGNRAIFLQRAFGDWNVIFSPEIVHTDYPLLLPLLSMRTWRFTGDETLLAGVTLALAFTACTFAALGGSVARLRGAKLGGLAVLGLCATPFFAVQGAGQTGDVPLACFALLAAAWARLGGARAYVVCGAFAGLAAWTKNEGALVAGALLFWLLASRARAAGLRAAAVGAGRALAGAAAALAALVAFKIWLAPRNDLVANHDAAKILPMLTSRERWGLVGRAYGDLLLWLRGAGAVTGLGPVMLVAAALLLGRQRGGRFLGVEVAAVLTVLAGEFVVFLLSPYDLRWHLGTALDRLVLQVWPLTLFGVALAVRTGDDDLESRAPPASG